MEYQGYLSRIEGHFRKSEYISIAQTSIKMLWKPAKKLDTELFCFVLNGTALSDKLCSELVRYALSVSFCDKEKSGRPGIIVLSVGQSLSDRLTSYLCKKAKRQSGVAVLPAAFDLNEQKLIVCKNLPAFFSKDFKTLVNFANSKFKI